MPEIRAPAKINLCLRVGSRRPDGYHPVCTLMEKVDLFDRLRIDERASGVSVSGADLPEDTNSVSRARAALAREAGISIEVGVELEKHIPVAAGLAGGSSDAAAALMALRRMFAPDITDERLAALALELGADVPFFLSPGPRLAVGIGEQLEPVGNLPSYSLVLVTPDLELSTARVYREYDRLGGGNAGDRGDIGAGGGDAGSPTDAAGADPMEAAAGALRRKLGPDMDLERLAALLVNDLEPAAIGMAPVIGALKSELLSLGAAASLMSGSGPSVFGLFGDPDAARAAAGSLAVRYQRTWTLTPLR